MARTGARLPPSAAGTAFERVYADDAGTVSFNGVDMRAALALMVGRFSDVLTPALRPRKISIPYRDGSYDFGAQYYDERVITIDCATAALASRAAARAFAGAGGQGRIAGAGTEPDKYYIGRIYDPADIERMAQGAIRFSLSFVCEPFAYGAQNA